MRENGFSRNTDDEQVALTEEAEANMKKIYGPEQLPLETDEDLLVLSELVDEA